MYDRTYGRFSIFADDPVEVLSVEHGVSDCPFSTLAHRVAAYPASATTDAPVPFLGGWIGFVTYEAGLTIEGLLSTAPWEPALPLLRFCLYDAAAVFDHRARQWYMVAVEWPSPLAARRPSVNARFTHLRKRLEHAAGLATCIDSHASSPNPAVPNMSHSMYLDRVRRAKQYIAAGDIYQVNLTQRFTAPAQTSPVETYRRLCQSNPAPFAALLMWDDTAILSSSPELFLQLRDGHVVTRPIKGTRPRSGDPDVDAANRRALIESEKDGAELTMIVDLLRNDLGRVCSYGTVRVVSPGEIEEHPTVFHRVATIEGELRSTHDWSDLLRATFPGGSVTGAPKIRAMQIIDEFEPTCRGVYCGSIGWIGLDGSMSLNLSIRTMVQESDKVHLYAGGAIVADSEPEDEYEETIAKATGMLRALGCDRPCRTPQQQEVPAA